MAYQALYRKYRPSNFDEVVGQQPIIQTLKNAIVQNRIAHAYLFCGPRGTGKTSIAKIFAKMLNCEDESNKPCGKCTNCKMVQNGSHPDIIEIDAASNNGVDEVRNLIDKVKYAPMQGKYKVYIIDEVHMMTTGAFNALLKTIEEPPAHVVFILATTEPNKVIPTIISRCQRFDFNKVSQKDIEKRLSIVCKEEKIEIDSEVPLEDLGYGNLVDQLYKKVARPNVLGPVYLIKHPIELSPLARDNDDNKNITDRFQLIINGAEIINAYSELVDPQDQEARLLKQAELKAKGDVEAMPMDYEYIEAMEYGMPPISGWGMGIDRLLQILTNSENIKDVILFPLMRKKD